jgi:hypothetical protein
LESILHGQERHAQTTVGKRKRQHEIEPSVSVCYGIISDMKSWTITRCTLGTTDGYALTYPLFDTFDIPLDMSISSPSWNKDVQTVFGYIVGILESITSGGPLKEKRQRVK